MRTRRRSRRRPGSRAASAPPRSQAGPWSRRSAGRRCRRRAGAATASRWRRPPTGSLTSSPPSTAIVLASVNDAPAGDDGDLVRLDDARDPVHEPVDDALLVRLGLGEVELRRRDLHAELREVAVRLLERMRGLHPRLRRDAAHGDARPADPVRLDQHDAGAELGGADRRGIATRPASEYRDVTFHRTAILATRDRPSVRAPAAPRRGRRSSRSSRRPGSPPRACR